VHTHFTLKQLKPREENSVPANTQGSFAGPVSHLQKMCQSRVYDNKIKKGQNRGKLREFVFKSSGISFMFFPHGWCTVALTQMRQSDL
jgi:hypothetical protein